MLTFILENDYLIGSSSLMPHVVLKDHPHRLTKYEGKGKGTKISILKLLSQLGKIWKCNLGFSKIPISYILENWRSNFESMDEFGKVTSH